ncbi:unnamed protein product [Caenorhabditis bovis]|uniref:Uncharacterized protein n=1 Tax=Caenorhabditis bovis TaxID=2654633 RepID=A0A8S1F2N2_9PELO|nr:unnamed protein product [Caenorhabditis bovis]
MIRPLLCLILATTGVLAFHRQALFNHIRKTNPPFKADASITIKTAFVKQPINHFLESDGYFSQRYIYSTQFTGNKKAVFLFVTNNEALEEDVLADHRNPLVKLAKQFGATMFGLEHRYYGISRPYDVDNLRHLSSLQALFDIDTFIKFANKEFNFDSDVRWIVWGVGYGGFLAAQSRNLFPDIVAGAIASSAPSKHKMDFWEYNNQVEASINEAAHAACTDLIAQAFKDLSQQMLSPEGRKNVSTTFRLTTPLDQTNLTDNDIQEFYAQIIAPFQAFVEFHGNDGFSINDVCATMENNSFTGVENIFNVYLLLLDKANSTFVPLNTNYNDNIKAMRNESVDSPIAQNRISWWQACSEFGYFANTNNKENAVFGASLPSNIFINQCIDVFPEAHFTAQLIEDNTIIFNNFYGPSMAALMSSGFKGTNVVFTCGQLDPWNPIAVQTSDDISVVTYVIPDVSFGADLFPGKNDNDDILKAHALFETNIYRWINLPKNPTTHVNITKPWTRPQPDFATLPASSRFGKLPDGVPSKKTFPKGKLNKKWIMGRPPHGMRPLAPIEKEFNYPPGFEVGTFRQKVDHFDNSNPNMFNQKYYKNAQWAKPGGPNFLMIGGEGPESERWVLNENITYLTFAQKYGATVYLLEHRFYGDSLVGDNTEFETLSSLQMLYDLAEFINAVNLQTGNSSPWITFGGSYSGALSAWMIEVFPELVTGAVASSAPVYAKTDFHEYLTVVENSIRDYNNECAERIKDGFATMHQLFYSNEGRANLSTIFALDPKFGDVVTETDKHYFFSNIFGNYQGAVQYSGDNTGAYATGHGIPDMCRIMLNKNNTPIENVAAFNRYMTEFYNGNKFTSTDNNYQDMVDELKNAQRYGPNEAASLLWTYQTCTEFGYFQTSDNGNGIFGSPTPVNMYIQLCRDLFEYEYDVDVDSRVAYTNYQYGSRMFYRGNNVVLPNGGVDPWHALGLSSSYNSNPTVVPFFINGTAHCADMYPARDQDLPGLKQAREVIDQNIAKWLNQYNSGTTVTSTISSNITQSTTPKSIDMTTKSSSVPFYLFTILSLIVLF